MKLKDSVIINDFLEAAQKCSGDVFLQTAEGDILNLKSLLSKYALTALMSKKNLLESAQIVCVQEEDYQKLAEFLVEVV